MDTTFTVEKLDGEPILLATVFADFSIARDMPLSDAASQAYLDATTDPLFWVIDVSQFTPTFDAIVQGANRGARGEKPLWHHPMIRQMIFVSPHSVVHTAAKGMNSVSFGRLHIQVFSTVEEALMFCRTALNRAA